VWVDNIRYLDIAVVKSCKFMCFWITQDDHFFRSVNALYSKLERPASNEVFLHLVNSKCMPILSYPSEVCSLVYTVKLE